jgi:crotonobetainyl-CoA:carnitine CoA-transferase CaiB-like acyl-CoA transferase
MPERALDGLRVVECGDGAAASYAGKLLADLGADVVKVEHPGTGHPARYRGPFPGGQPHPEKSGLFLYLNCNKQGVTLDLRDPRGRELLDRLLTSADVLLTDYRPRDADARGLEYERLKPDFPSLVVASITPFGLTGPHRDYAAHELTTLSAGGWTWINGAPGETGLPPLKPFGLQASYQGALAATAAVLGALLWRDSSGRGQLIDVSIQEAVASIIELTYVFWPYMHLPAVRWGQRPVAPVNFFECKDGWLFIFCLEEAQWQSFVDLMGNPEWASWDVFANRFTRASNVDALEPLIQEFVKDWTVDDLYRAAQAKRVPFAPVSTVADLLDSEHLKARGFFVEVAHPQTGPLTYPGAPYKHGVTPWQIRSPAPALGQHSEAVFCERLGLPRDELRSLQEAGVV